MHRCPGIEGARFLWATHFTTCCDVRWTLDRVAQNDGRNSRASLVCLFRVTLSLPSIALVCDVSGPERFRFVYRLLVS